MCVESTRVLLISERMESSRLAIPPPAVIIFFKAHFLVSFGFFRGKGQFQKPSPSFSFSPIYNEDIINEVSLRVACALVRLCRLCLLKDLIEPG